MNQRQKIWEQKANRVLRVEGLRLAQHCEPGWYHTFTVPECQEEDGGTVNAWVTDLEV